MEMKWQNTPPTRDQLKGNDYWWVRYYLEWNDEVEEGKLLYWKIPHVDIVQASYSLESVRKKLRQEDLEHGEGITFRGLAGTKIDLEKEDTYKSVEWCQVQTPPDYEEFIRS